MSPTPQQPRPLQDHYAKQLVKINLTRSAMQIQLMVATTSPFLLKTKVGLALT